MSVAILVVVSIAAVCNCMVLAQAIRRYRRAGRRS